MKISFINPNKKTYAFPNLELAYLISYIEKNHNVQLIDTNFINKDILLHIYKRIKYFQPDIIGFHTSINNHKFSLEIAKGLKKINPDIFMFWLGVYPTLFPEDVLKNSLVNAVCIGEGEVTVSSFLEKLENGESIDVEGIWYRSNTGEIIKNSRRPFLRNLKGLPILNYDYWDVEKYLKTNDYFEGGLTFLSSRGCPFKCRFCINPPLNNQVPGNPFRVRPVNDVIKEIEYNYMKYSLKAINFGDEVFGLNREHFEEFTDEYRKSGLSKILPWTCQTRPELVTDQWCKMANNAGVFLVSMGIETGNEYRRKILYNKNISNNQIYLAAANLKKYDILFKFNMIIGGPQETDITLRESLSMIWKYKPGIVLTRFYVNFPKTDIYNKKEEIIPVNKFRIILIIFYIRLSLYRMFNCLKLKGARFFIDLFLKNEYLRLRGFKHTLIFYGIMRSTFIKYKLQGHKSGLKTA